MGEKEGEGEGKGKEEQEVKEIDDQSPLMKYRLFTHSKDLIPMTITATTLCLTL